MTPTCRHYAAQILLGQLTIDDVPENRQTSVLWLIRRCGPDTAATDPIEVVVGMMQKIESLRRG